MFITVLSEEGTVRQIHGLREKEKGDIQIWRK